MNRSNVICQRGSTFLLNLRKKVSGRASIAENNLLLCPILGGFQTRKKSDRDYGPFPAILTFTIFATIIPEKDIRILSFCLPSFLAAEERRRASVCIINRYLARCVNRKKKRSCLRQETIIPQNIKEIRRQIVKNTSLLKIGTTKQSQKREV